MSTSIAMWFVLHMWAGQMPSMSNDGGEPSSLSYVLWMCCDKHRSPAPVDVPAVEEAVQAYCSWGSLGGDAVGWDCANGGHVRKGTKEPLEMPLKQFPIKGEGGHRTTCADKTRILMHDEEDPPKYWCHKVQP